MPTRQPPIMLLLLPLLCLYADGAVLPPAPAEDKAAAAATALFAGEPAGGKPDTAAGVEHRLPSAIIIGVKKAGTRALLEYLRLNPRIRAPGPEVHYFDRYYDRGAEWYRRQMPPTTVDQLTVEKTPSYFVTGAVPKRVHELNPRMKLIVVVRDPVTRAISDYTQTASKRPGMASFESMAFNSSDASVNARWGAVRIGLYARHVRKWLPHFARRQMLFVDGRRLIDAPAEEVNRAERFLGLRPAVRAEQFVFDEAKGFPCVLKETGGEPHCLGKTKGRAHPVIGEQALQRLRTFYAPHNEQFFRLIGRRFDW